MSNPPPSLAGARARAVLMPLMHTSCWNSTGATQETSRWPRRFCVCVSSLPSHYTLRIIEISRQGGAQRKAGRSCKRRLILHQHPGAD